MEKCREYCLEIYALNDVHGRFFNTPHYDAASTLSLANAGTFLKERRRVVGAGNVLLLDCGDNLQGDMAVDLSNRKVTEDSFVEHFYSKVARYLSIDAVVFGNHDFEAGHKVYDQIARKLQKDGTVVLGANVIDAKTGGCYFAPYTIFHRGGLRIAVIGATNPSTPRWITKDLWSGLEFYPIAPVVQPIIDKIRQEGTADVVILMAHTGMGAPDAADVDENQALALAGRLKGVDVIVAGHDHKESCMRVGDTLVVSASSHAASLQSIKVHVSKDASGAAAVSVEGTVVQLEEYPADREYLAAFGEEIWAVERHMQETVGKLKGDMHALDALFGKNDYVSLIHAVQLDATGAQVSFASPYVYDAVFEAGPVTRKEIYRMYSCENTFYKIRMTGRQIKDYLEYSYSKWVADFTPDNPSLLRLQKTTFMGKKYFWPEHFTYNFDSAAGLEYQVDFTAASGDRVKILSLSGGTPFLEEGVYTVALSSYRICGGGNLIDSGAGLDPMADLERITLKKYPLIRDLLEAFIREGKDFSNVPGHWEFVPADLARQLIAQERKLLSV